MALRTVPTGTVRFFGTRHLIAYRKTEKPQSGEAGGPLHLLGMAEVPVRKTSFHISAEAKRNLETLKSDLRFQGYVGVSESAIVELLVSSAKLSDVKRHFKKRP